MKNKKILIIVGGGISAYKVLDFIRILKKNKNSVRTILTKSGKKFVTPLSITALTGEKPFEKLFASEDESKIDHISLSRWADLIVVIPTTANVISKLSQGRAEDLSTTVLLASNKDIFLVPAMNVRMWEHKATQENLKKLLDFGYYLIGPKKGQMACGEYGLGKMSSPRIIFKKLKDFYSNKEKFKKINLSAIVTAGPTREYIDPVRYISNESSGKQGLEIAKKLSKEGVKTTLILGPSNLEYRGNFKTIKVTTAKEMLEKVKKNLPVNIVICSAAVADFKFKTKSEKIKKRSIYSKKLELSLNVDILDYLGKTNYKRPNFIIGFCAETKDLLKSAKKKLWDKRCDMIVANYVNNKNKGFNSDYNEVILIDKLGKIEKIKKNKKSFIASKIVELCKEAGVLLTPAGATHPYGNDPKNNTLRIAPTFINEKELEIAMDVFVTAAQIAHSQA